mgnify:CR=1 FL=1
MLDVENMFLNSYGRESWLVFFLFQKKLLPLVIKILQLRLLYTNPYRNTIAPSYVGCPRESWLVLRTLVIWQEKFQLNPQSAQDFDKQIDWLSSHFFAELTKGWLVILKWTQMNQEGCVRLGLKFHLSLCST